MGLFDIFKKMKSEPVRNNPNSLFTLRFTVPYFQIFDKTNPKLKSLPITMAVSGSCQYRISEPDLCFDNVSLGEMSPEQLEAHVKDVLTMNVKSYFNSISDFPLLQFEQRIAAISDGCKRRLTQQFNEEYGLDLRTFSISEVRYDTEHPNYMLLQKLSQIELDNQAKFADATSDAELDTLKAKTEAEKTKIRAMVETEAERIRHEFDIERRRKEDTLETDLTYTSAEKASIRAKGEMDAERIRHEFDLERRRKENGFEADLTRTLAEKETIRAKSEIEAERIRHEFDLERRRKENDFETDLSIKGKESGFDFDTSDLDSFDTSDR